MSSDLQAKKTKQKKDGKYSFFSILSKCKVTQKSSFP